MLMLVAVINNQALCPLHAFWNVSGQLAQMCSIKPQTQLGRDPTTSSRTPNPQLYTAASQTQVWSVGHGPWLQFVSCALLGGERRGAGPDWAKLYSM
ncbi:hypothetical protein AAFF_G00009070 [Aldrovandia affinis]|uniref:Uncharacterized protein n=1 Tax=Aldrovandia affinis TaxID=143900 RepID=A0AAD7T698_9TELE|nr:hypothetical protein AAFF_G00009070 [Aldrovandia affinis]